MPYGIAGIYQIIEWLTNGNQNVISGGQEAIPYQNTTLYIQLLIWVEANNSFDDWYKLHTMWLYGSVSVKFELCTRYSKYWIKWYQSTINVIITYQVLMFIALIMNRYLICVVSLLKILCM